MSPEATEDFEVDLVVEAIRRRGGPDFSTCARSSLVRRLRGIAHRVGAESLSALIRPILYDDDFFTSFTAEICVSATSFFRNPSFFAYLREEIIPYIATFPRPRIWHAGCASGQEAYSLAMLLAEAGILDRTLLFATDVDLDALRIAANGVYSIDEMETSTRAYVESGGRACLSDHFTTGPFADQSSNRLVMIDSSLRNAIRWSYHDLTTPSPFLGMNLIVCRNTLAYFTPSLQFRVLSTLADSLVSRGILGLGQDETAQPIHGPGLFAPLSLRHRVYRRRDRIPMGTEAAVNRPATNWSTLGADLEPPRKPV